MAGTRPAVLFVGGVHAGYVVKPLVEMGIEVDTCKAGALRERLAGGAYNVVVTGEVDDVARSALDAFMSDGGGVFVTNPGHNYSRERDWIATNRWLESKGARPRFEILYDTDPENTVAGVFPMMKLSFSAAVLPQFNEGVRGVLTVFRRVEPIGWEGPMSFDFGAGWTVVVRGTASMRAEPSKMPEDKFAPWIPKRPIDGSPPLLAVREMGKGRMAVLAIRGYWLFDALPNCPTTEEMLSRGAGGKPSDWLRVCANTFRWLAEPSLNAGMGGATTPKEVIEPSDVWEPRPRHDWSKAPALVDQPQVPGLIGARTALSSGSGSVSEYVEAAKTAGLQFIVFLEDSLAMDQAKWDELVVQCDAASDGQFAAIPGLTYEDAQGNHLYAFADDIKFPKPEWLLSDRRLGTLATWRTTEGSYFNYVNRYMTQRVITGFWRHRENWIHVADYKLYNSFPIHSFVDGRAVDDAFDEYRYLTGVGGCQAVLALEVMNRPELVAQRARNGWRVVAHRGPTVLRSKWHQGAWAFSGMGSQYITNGPKILAWRRLAPPSPHGQWWRPDLWHYRVALRVASKAGLKTVTIHDGDRRVLRRWLPNGASSFEQEMVLPDVQQLALFLVVEDLRGRRAISMAYWQRNLVLQEFMQSDRCNFGGQARLRTKQGQKVFINVGFARSGVTPNKGKLELSLQPALGLTHPQPDLPIDGGVGGLPSASLRFGLQVPSELRHLFSYPTTYLVGPEIAIGQGNYRLGYDPAEEGAKKTQLGHPYEQPQPGWGNAWSSWHRLVPTRALSGWSRTYASNWLLPRFRVGWHETRTVLKQDIGLDPAKGIQVMYTTQGPWRLWRSQQPVRRGEGSFTRGTYATIEEAGGSTMLIAFDDTLHYKYYGDQGLTLFHRPGGTSMKKGQTVHFVVGFAGAPTGTSNQQMHAFARQFGIAEPGTVGYGAEITRGRELDNYLTWRLEADAGAIEAKLRQADLAAFLTTEVNGLNDNWTVYLLDRARPGRNFRGLPIRDGRAFAQLDLTDADLDLFIGHPVLADDPNVMLLVAWRQEGQWSVEAHNRGDRPIRTRLRSNRGWTLFDFDQVVELPAGASRVCRIQEGP